MSELLAPAGNYEALIAAISNGADAIYLGMNKFGARAYASNFDMNTLKEAVQYAHLRKVKIYVTLNTILFEDELEEMKQRIDQLYEANVDGIIIQDLAAFHYVTSTYPDLEAHCSTQMGIDDLEGTLLFKELKASRVVLSREVDINTIKEIKKIAKIPLEIFIHGALCVSYSGNCLMSGLIGYRSGNRGRCVGSCRKPYTLYENNKEIASDIYILSMKDLNTIDYINDLKHIDSLKIEGRMKEPAYVANVVKTYRNALDNTLVPAEKILLNKTFNRTFTKGYIFFEDKKNITNILKPNNFGYPIGKIVNKTKIGYEINLNQKLNQNDIIRIDHKNNDINLTVAKLYDAKGNYIHSSTTSCFIAIKEELSIGDIVYKTKDIEFYSSIEKTYPKEYRRFPLVLEVYAYTNQKLCVNASCENHHIYYESEEQLATAKSIPTSEIQFQQQFDRLKDSVYQLSSLSYQSDNVFIPAKLINEARRSIVKQMNEERLNRNKIGKAMQKPIQKITFPKSSPVLAVYATTKDQYDAALGCGIKIIYTNDNTIRRNNTIYPDKSGPLLVGGYGGIYAYRNKNEITSDFSLNVVNSKAVHLLHSLNVNRVTLSYEMNKKNIADLIEAYKKENDGYPNLEMIVYGHAHLLYTKYCPLKKLNLCKTCKTKSYFIEDEYGRFPILSHEDCTTTILNGKILNLIDELNEIENIQVFRLQFTTESKEETTQIIKKYQNKLIQKNKTNFFNKETDTRGHYNKEIL
ncbi:MAG: DUF3656 domain-containing protein [Anaeroplasmataceae bacterium]|nr:DUF3656 domain-containing protein [Anaeroplasmataceae bacterium]